jgi:hypothetical protein
MDIPSRPRYQPIKMFQMIRYTTQTQVLLIFCTKHFWFNPMFFTPYPSNRTYLFIFVHLNKFYLMYKFKKNNLSDLIKIVIIFLWVKGHRIFHLKFFVGVVDVFVSVLFYCCQKTLCFDCVGFSLSFVRRRKHRLFSYIIRVWIIEIPCSPPSFFLNHFFLFDISLQSFIFIY